MSLSDTKPFWFYMTLGDERGTEQVPLPAELDQAIFQDRHWRRRSSAWRPASSRPWRCVSSASRRAERGDAWRERPQLLDAAAGLADSARWLDTDLKSGQVPADADLLMVLDPVALDTKQVFAIDQFLMQGGTVLVAAAPTDVVVEQSIIARPVKSGLEDWLAAYGLSLRQGSGARSSRAARCRSRCSAMSAALPSMRSNWPSIPTSSMCAGAV